MKRIFILSIILLLAFAGVVGANNLYKDKPIVNVQYNGADVSPVGVPAYLEDGYTMVPLGLLRKMGFTVEWDNATKSANVITRGKRNNPSLTLDQIKSHDAVAVVYGIDQFGRRVLRGTGFMLNSKGLMVTASHVLDKYAEFEIVVRGKTYKIPSGSTVFQDAEKDIAGVFLHDSDPFPYFFIGSLPDKGDTVYALGNPPGEFRVFSEGKVSSSYTNNGTHILTTVPAEGGFSGGPLLNEKGEVVGVLIEIILELNYAVAISIDDVIEAYRNSI